MKKIIFIAIFMSIGKMLSAQAVEIKANPILIPFNIWQVSAEILLKDDIGLEPGFVILPEADGAAIFSVIGKYYFNPSIRNNDRFYIGLFTNYITETTGPGVGFYVGYKLLSRKAITFEIGAGVGRIIGDADYGVTGLGQLTVGYRIPSKKSE